MYYDYMILIWKFIRINNIIFFLYIYFLFYIFKFIGKFGDGVNIRKKLFGVIIKYGLW